LDNKLGQDIIPTNIDITLDNDLIIMILKDKLNLDSFGLIKGHNSKVLYGIWLVIRLDQEIMLTNNVTMFDDDPLKNIQVTGQTRLIWQIWLIQGS